MFKIKIETDTAAFQYDNCENEVKRILAEIVVKINNGQTCGKCIDINGNTLGNGVGKQ